jgi:hypothetical protein
VLLQTLVISVIISMIAVMVMKWVLARYTLANRVQRNAVAVARADGCYGSRVAAWSSTGLPSPGGCDPGVGTSVTGAYPSWTVTITVNE